MNIFGMSIPYNFEMMTIYLGGLTSLAFTVLIIYVKRRYKRVIESERLNLLPEPEKEVLGDIDARLDDSYEYQKVDILKSATQFSVQPLFIIAFLNLYVKSNNYSISLFGGVVALTILHEFWTMNEYSDSWKYQVFMLTIWIISFLISSYAMNLPVLN